MLGAEVLHLLLCEVGVDLDLVDRRHHRRAVEQRCEVLDHEVADPDRADLAISQQRLQGPVSLQGPVERRGQRLVQDQQVDLVDAEPAGALLEAVQRLLIPIVTDPDLGLQEDLRSVQGGTVDGLTDLPFVAVGRCGVDIAVPAVECGPDSVAGFGRGVWKTPRPSAGISTPLLSVMVSMSLTFLFELVASRFRGVTLGPGNE